METETCRYCRQEIPEDEWDDHEKGTDVRRLACPHQDLEEIAAAQESDSWWDRVW